MNYVNPLIICAVLMSISIQTGCSSKPAIDSKTEAKLDAPLRMKLKEAKHPDSDSLLQCLLKVKGSFDEEKQQTLDEIGIRVLTVVNEIITIEGHTDAIRKVASFDFVHSIALSQTRTPPEKQ